MGILYSLTNFFYPSNKNLSETTIRVKSQKLTLHIKQMQYRLQQATKKQEQILQVQLNQPRMTRSRQAEQLKMTTIIQNSQKMQVLNDIIYSLNKIINEAHELQHSPQNISKQCVRAVCSVIYAYEPLQLKQFVDLSQFLPESKLSIGIDKTSPIIQKYLQKKQVTHYQLNLYACQFAQRYKTDLDIFNDVGHNFYENPEKPQEATPSSNMFAVTLEDIPIGQFEQK